jgi:hypothetical protein
MLVCLVVGEGAAPSRHANLTFSGTYKVPLHGWCYPPSDGIVLFPRGPCVTMILVEPMGLWLAL